MKRIISLLLLSISFVVGAATTTTYDFTLSNQGVDIFAYEGTTSNQLPSSNDTPSSQLSSADYDYIEINNNAYHDLINYTENVYPALLYVVEIDEAASEVTELNVFWNGFGSNSKSNKTDGVLIYIWNSNSNSYDFLKQSTNDWVEELDSSITSNISDYIDSNNQVSIYIVSQEKTFNNETNWLGTDYFSLTVTANDVFVPASPIAEYRFDKTSYDGSIDEVVDSIGGFNGQSISAQPIEGKVCNAIDLSDNGTSDYVILDESILSYKTDFTVSLWAQTSNNSNQSLLSGANSSTDNELIMWLSNGSRFRPYLKGSYNSDVSIISIADTSWHHLVWTRSGTDNCLYRDNVLQGCKTLSSSALNIQSLILGQEQDNVGGGFSSSQDWEGLIDELLVYDSAISDDEISGIYNNQSAGLGYDGSSRTCVVIPPQIPIAEFRFDKRSYNESANEVVDSIGDFHGITSQVQPDDGLLCNAVDLSATGTSDFIILDSEVLSGRDDFTVSVWGKTAKTGSQGILSGAKSGSFNELIMWFSSGTQFAPHLKSTDNGSLTISAISDDEWHHLVWTRDGTQNCLFIDKVLQGCKTLSSSTLDIDSLIIGQEQDSLGGGFDSGQAWNGLLDELLIFDAVIPEYQIEEIYDNQMGGLGYDGSVRTCPSVNILANFQMDEVLWDGSSGEVLDETGNFNAITVDGVITDGASPALTGNPGTCRYGSFNDNYVALPDSFENLQGSFTITAWINPSNIDEGSRIFADDELNQTGYAFSLGDPGNGKLRFYSRGVSPVSVDTTTSIPINTWTFVTAVHNSDNKTRQIYINGQPQIVTGGGTSNTYTGSWGTDAGVASIGGETDAGESNRRFTGSIDEVRVYESALSQSEIASVYNETHDCTEPAINHYQIIHDGNGLTCDAETVTIKACTNTYDGSCTLSTDAVTLDVIAIGGPTVTNSLTFTGTDEVDLSYTTAESVALSLDNISISPSNTTVCNDNSSGSCNISFANAGFRFLSGTSGTSEVIANQISGTNFPLRLQAVENSGGVCTGLFTGNIDVKLAQENLDPIGTTGLKFNVNGSDIDKYPNISTKASLNFGSDSIATIPSAYYKDAGQIRLQASYINSGVTLVGSSQNFWVSPNKLVITAQSSGSNIDGATASSTTVHKAGENFDLVVTAYNSLGTGDENITKNYQQGQLQLKLTRVKPTITGSVDGGLNYASGSTITSGISPVFADHALTSFSDGKSTFSNAQFAEVGIINLAVQDINYGSQGLSIAATDITIGRFTPNHFEQTVQAGGSFLSTCNRGSTTFAYSGQKDDATQTQGTISYLSNPVLKIIAKNAAGATVENYYQDSEGTVDDFMKLTASEINITEPTIDSSNVGIDLSSLPVSSAMSRGILSQTVTRGELEYKFSDSDRFYYQRSSNTLVTPFISDIDFTVASIISVIDDDISATTTNNVTSTVGIDIRFGRLVLENTFGPETSNLPLVLKAEYFDGSNFVLNTDDHCTAFNPNKISLTNLGLDPALSAVIGANGIFVDGFANDISLQATGTNNLGDIGIDYDTFEWLKFKWNNTDENSDFNFYDDNPSAVATFGVYRGNDRIISWREVGN